MEWWFYKVQCSYLGTRWECRFSWTQYSKHTDISCAINTVFDCLCCSGGLCWGMSPLQVILIFVNYVEVCCLSTNRRMQGRPQDEGLFSLFKDPSFSLKMLQHLQNWWKTIHDKHLTVTIPHLHVEGHSERGRDWGGTSGQIAANERVICSRRSTRSTGSSGETVLYSRPTVHYHRPALYRWVFEQSLKLKFTFQKAKWQCLPSVTPKNLFSKENLFIVCEVTYWKGKDHRAPSS